MSKATPIATATATATIITAIPSSGVRVDRGIGFPLSIALLVRFHSMIPIKATTAPSAMTIKAMTATTIELFFPMQQIDLTQPRPQ